VLIFPIDTSFCKFPSHETKIAKCKNFRTVILCHMKHCNILVFMMMSWNTVNQM
jgi:hypothetical protein